ncbi:hypothetical protein VIBR0546_15261, partial [Vibrio brasiliensis LMG 20546]
MRRWTYWLLLLCLTPSVAISAPYFNQIGWLESDSQLHRLLQYPAVVEDIYRNNNNQMIWFDLQQSS